MKYQPLARSSVLIVPLLCSLACSSSNPPRVDLKNNTNAPMIPTNGSGTLGTIERLDPGLDQLLEKDAKMEILAQGLDWAEGPVWDARHGRLIFSDVPQNTAYQWSAGKGVSVYLKPSGYTGATPRGGEPGSNGLTMDREGRLVLCEHGDRRVARLETDGKKTTLADRYEGKRFNSPNDLVFDSAGNLFFTDPPYGLEGKLEDAKKELPFQGVYRIATDGQLKLVTKDIKFPNGIALSPDEKTLYVAASDPDKPVIWAFDLKADGTVGNGRVFFDAAALAANKKLKGLPDGMKVDVKGNIFLGGPGGILVISSKGKHLGTILTGEATANCAWGDDGSTLYVTADMYLCRIKTATRGKIPGT